MDACIFCRIARGEIPATTVHEDDHTLAFLDITPLAEGHTLVIPKVHARELEDMGDAARDALWRTVADVSGRVRRALGAPATTLAVNNGPAAGQEVPHVHVHVVPRNVGDGGGPIHAIMAKRPDLPKDSFGPLAKRIRDA